MGEQIEYRTAFDYSDMMRQIYEQANRLIDEQAVEQVRERLAELGYRKCSECKERQGYYLDAETIQSQQEHIEKLTVDRDAYFEMVKQVQADCDARDELIRDMWPFVLADGASEAFEKRMRELGIEVRRSDK
jgi:DNA-binding ferritin-like protein